MPQEPLKLLEKIIYDGEFFHLGTRLYSERNKRLRIVFQAFSKSRFSDDEWRLLNINFKKSHKYFRNYCRKKLEPVKQGWLEQLQSKQGTLS